MRTDYVPVNSTGTPPHRPAIPPTIYSASSVRLSGSAGEAGALDFSNDAGIPLQGFIPGNVAFVPNQRIPLDYLQEPPRRHLA